jgi:hypothetical protein
MKQFKIILLVLISICVGILIGGYLFSQSQPRSFLAINRCQNCLTHEDLLGLIASVGIQKFPSLMPFVVFETDKTVVIKHPFSLGRIHYVIIPKKDIKNIGEISEADTQYLTDAFLLSGGLSSKRSYQSIASTQMAQVLRMLHIYIFI